MTHKKNHISIRLKKLGLTIFNSAIAGLIFLFKTLSPIFKFFWKTIKFFTEIVFKISVLPTYKIYLRIKNNLQKNKATGGIYFNFFSNKIFFNILIFIAVALIFTNNIQTKSTLAEEVGKGSIIFEIAKRGEFSETKETLITVFPDEKKSVQEQNKENTIADENKNTSTTSILGGELGKNSLTNSKIADISVALNANNPIASGMVARSSSPETASILPERKEIIQYVVEGGDTVASIAKKFGISINTILWENKISSAGIIKPGQTLLILPTSGISYNVVKNDTIGSIAKKYGITVEEIISTNNLASAGEIRSGQKLIIPNGRPPAAKITTPSLATVFERSPGNLGTANTRVGGLIWPTVSKHITQYFGWKHTGLDVGSKSGLAIYAAMDGVVTYAGWGSGYGNYVDVDHGGGKKTRYGHMSKIFVKKGQEVAQGETIGAIGSTGWSTGPHLHFEYIINGSKVNPLSYL
jgi:LysM repeat protein